LDLEASVLEVEVLEVDFLEVVLEIGLLEEDS
jgi:hypothetical protein